MLTVLKICLGKRWEHLKDTFVFENMLKNNQLKLLIEILENHT